MQTEDLKESSKQTTAEETPQQEAQTNTADAANGVDETAGKKSEGAAEEKTPEQDEKDVKIEELQNRILRLQADFDNFRRRNTSEREQLATFVTADVVGKFLKVLDNFERALSAPATDETKAFLDGFVMIHQNLMDMLKKHGLATIEAVGQPFDPNFHQAIMRVESDEYEDDTVCEVLQTGYTVDGKTVRPAMVKVVHNG